MARKVEQKIYSNFVGGLNTEAGYLTSPMNAWLEGYNIIPSVSGELQRRKGLDLEAEYEVAGSATEGEKSAYAYTTYEWNSVAGNGSRNFLVAQEGPIVRFYNNFGGTVSDTVNSFELDLTDYQPLGNPNVVGVNPISCSSANGKLLVVSKDTEPVILQYFPDTDTFIVTELDIEIRDLYGLDDGLEVDEKPSVLSPEHNYNLQNQGWPTSHINSYFSAKAVYPSNAQVWVAGKDTSDVFQPNLLDLQDFGSTPAPKGRFVLDLFNRDRSTLTGLVGIPAEVERYRPTSVAFFSGRAWYAGFDSETISSWVVFSQVAETDDNLGKCYQSADPTSEFISDLVATDGGVIPIQDVGTILKLLPLGNSMMVIADNGIWQIVGTDLGFTADSYSVNKISSVGALSGASVVEVETTALYWGVGGIYTFARDSATTSISAGVYSVTPITDENIQSFYNDIPTLGKNYVAGKYNSESKIVTWAYNSDPAQSGLVDRYYKNTLLNYDVRLKAFYTHEIETLDSEAPFILDVFVTNGRTSTDVEYNVLVGADQVLVGVDSVIVALAGAGAATRVTKFYTLVSNLGSYGVTMSDFLNERTDGTQYNDWYAVDSAGVEVIPYILTGYEVGSNRGTRDISALYVLAFMKRTELGWDASGDAINEGSVKVQARWDWHDLSSEGRWSPEQQCYRHKRVYIPESFPSEPFTTESQVVTTKNKVRGYGRAVQFKWTGEADKDFNLISWGVLYLGEENI